MNRAPSVLDYKFYANEIEKIVRHKEETCYYNERHK